MKQLALNANITITKTCDLLLGQFALQLQIEFSVSRSMARVPILGHEMIVEMIINIIQTVFSNFYRFKTAYLI